jgi:hypothetical protein
MLSPNFSWMSRVTIVISMFILMGTISVRYGFLSLSLTPIAFISWFRVMLHILVVYWVAFIICLKK